MALTLSKTNIVTGQTIQASQITQSVDALTGTTAYDITISGSLILTGSVDSLNGYTGSLLGTSSFAVSSSRAVTASFAISSSRAVTASFALNTTSPFPFDGNAVITGSLAVTGSQIITGSLTVTGPIRNVVNDGFVSCSFSVSGTGGSRSILASFLEVDGTALSNPRQLIHWWTSETQYAAATNIFGPVSPTYTIVSGSQVVANTTGSINHAVTNTSGVFGIRLSSNNISGTSTVWFHAEVQGIIYSTSTTIFNTGAA